VQPRLDTRKPGTNGTFRCFLHRQRIDADAGETEDRHHVFSFPVQSCAPDHFQAKRNPRCFRRSRITCARMANSDSLKSCRAGRKAAEFLKSETLRYLAEDWESGQGEAVDRRDFSLVFHERERRGRSSRSLAYTILENVPSVPGFPPPRFPK